MSDYFVDLIPKEEAEKLQYLPTLADFLEKIRTYGAKPALGTVAAVESFDELYANVARRRTFLYEKGFKKGDHIAILSKNSVSAVEEFLAITSAGFVAMNLPATLPKEAVFGVSKKFAFKAIFVAADLKASCELLTIPVFDLNEIGASEPSPAAELDKKDVACIFFTGGTTSAPKGAVLSHGAFMRGSYNAIFKPGSVSDQVGYTVLPFSHVFGFIMAIMGILYTGSVVYVCEDMRMIFRDIAMIRPTTMTLVPGLAEMLFGAAKMKGAAVLGDRLKVIISGAAPVPPRLLKDFEKFGIKVLPGYGLTETANLVSGNASIEEKPASVGKLYGGQQAKLVNGELWLKGDNVFEGYFNDPDATAAAFSEDGWFKTGDLAEFDEDGFLYITGRIKNLIILSNGENVSPEELEEIIYRSEYVKDCMVFEDKINDVPVIAVEVFPYLPLFQGKEKEEIEKCVQAEIIKINADLPSFKRIAKVLVRYDDFPRTPAMKIDRKRK